MYTGLFKVTGKKSGPALNADLIPMLKSDHSLDF